MSPILKRIIIILPLTCQHNLGCYEISLGDTIGVGTPEKTHKMLQAIKNIPKDKLAAHFHDTYDKACSNLMAALEVHYFLLIIYV